MSTAPPLEARLADVCNRLQTACRQAGRPADQVRLIAVSKTVDAAAILAAHAAGQRRFGESRVQELVAKAAALPADCEWHLIGPLQRNKVRQAVLAADWIHTVDSLPLLDRLERLAGEEGRRPVVLVQVNVSGETTKHGCSPADAPALVAAAVRCPHLACRGLMTIAPYDADPKALAAVFADLRQLRDRLSTALGVPLPELSMGMSGDFDTAIAEGATLVRIGTAIFGARN